MEHVLSRGMRGKATPSRAGGALGSFDPRRACKQAARVRLDIDDEEVDRPVKSFVTMVTIN